MGCWDRNRLDFTRGDRQPTVFRRKRGASGVRRAAYSSSISGSDAALVSRIVATKSAAYARVENAGSVAA